MNIKKKLTETKCLRIVYAEFGGKQAVYTQVLV